ncbi:SDR family oxidoreductase [Deinococcus radiotolerans]|uniref:dTDP-4-dehydrorhamnose reductase n=1 Tax=Deinococcus radiotolerans TaxID=1309407 RepID=A0ABQ2FG57_9DEIO|nr:sugar nucleotide-binding protein [Deinococcus radiotolerans]GGK95258.1 dTDP-4-rhamnose reductase [Deinococcus radiotolerans]
MKVLLTGGGGRLGTELRTLLPGVVAPPSATMNITDISQVMSVVKFEKPDIIVHAAAFTDVKLAETKRTECWSVNVEGTRNMVQAANEVGAILFHISTDYVFSGELGGYKESDTPGPTVNYYALTKLIAEEAVRCAEKYIIVRTSFRPREFQYPIAFSDVYTSQDYVDVIAPDIALAINLSSRITPSILHIATERKSVYELARRRNTKVTSGLKAQAGVPLPGDVSLNCDRWEDIKHSLLPII